MQISSHPMNPQFPVYSHKPIDNYIYVIQTISLFVEKVEELQFTI